MSKSFKLSQMLYQIYKNTKNYEPGRIDRRIFIVADLIGEGKKILDVGCYNGIYASILSERNNIIYGFDANEKAVRKANKRGIKARVADAENHFPYANQRFDVVYAGELIEHLFDTDRFIDECKRVLKRRGRLIITTPNLLSLPRRLMYLVGIGRFFEASKSYSTEGVAIGHIRFFTKGLLVDFLNKNGFKLKSFASDYVNLPFGLKSNIFAKLIPTFGRTLIAEFVKK